MSEDIEPDSHYVARNLVTQAAIMHEYEVIAGYHLDIKYTTGNPNRAVIPPEMKMEYYHECDLMCRKTFDFGLAEEIFIDIGNEEDEDTLHSSWNTSKYMYHKQMGNDADFESWLRLVKPDSIFIRPSKGEIIALGTDLVLVWNHIKNLSRKYIHDFLQEKTSTKF